MNEEERDKKISRIVDLVKSLYSRNGGKITKEIEEVVKTAVKCQEVELCMSIVWAIYLPKRLIHVIEPCILDANDANLSADFVIHEKYADISAHEKIIFESKNPIANLKMAKYINRSGPEFKKHEQIVIESNHINANLRFARLSGADVKAHERVILAANNPKASLEFARIPGANVLAHQKVVMDSGDITLCLDFSTNPDADVQALSQLILASNNSKANLTFAEINYNRGIDVRAHGNVVIDGGDAFENCEFAKIKGADVKAHEKVVLNAKNPAVSLQFIKNIKGADVVAHQVIICTYGTIDQIMNLAKYFHVADLDYCYNMIKQRFPSWTQIYERDVLKLGKQSESVEEDATKKMQKQNEEECIEALQIIKQLSDSTDPDEYIK